MRKWPLQSRLCWPERRCGRAQTILDTLETITNGVAAQSGRVLFMYTPGRAEKLFEEMVESPMDPMNQQEFGAVAERHGWEVVGSPPF